jgi:hypothetical protein
MNKDLRKDEIKFSHAEHVIVLLLRIVGPVFLMVAGLVLLYLRLPGWSLIFGLPVTIIGVVLFIYAYDEILSRGMSHKDTFEEHDY